MGQDTVPGKGPLISFGLFSDAHYASMVYGTRYCRDSMIKLRACVEAFRARRLAMAINLGDLIDRSEDVEADLAAVAEMCRAFSRFRGGRYNLLGNHDLATLTKEAFLQALSCDGCSVESRAPFYSFDRAGVHFAILDSNCHQDGSDFSEGDFDWGDAWISDAQLEWLASDLQRAKGAPTVVLCHGDLALARLPSSRPEQDEGRCHHLSQVDDADPHIVRNAPAVRQVLENAGSVWAVFQGHYHPGACVLVNGIPYITVRAMVEGPGTVNNAYAVVSLHPDRSVKVQGFGNQPSYHLAPQEGHSA